jgi:hypothetical protein
MIRAEKRKLNMTDCAISHDKKLRSDLVVLTESAPPSPSLDKRIVRYLS